MFVGARGNRLVACAVTFVLAGSVAGSAEAARFIVTLRGHDSLAWNVATPGDCGRSGNGLQSVDFHATDRHPVQISQVRVRVGGRLATVLEFGGLGSLTMDGQGTIRRQDNTTGFYPARDGCAPIPPKDCGTQQLTHPFGGGDARPGFEAMIWSNRHAGLAVEASYWGVPPSLADAPFGNCMALMTPISLIHNGSQRDYVGWQFGDQMLLLMNSLNYDYAPASRTVSPTKMRIRHSYDFAVSKQVRLTDAGLSPWWEIGANGGDGSGDTPTEQSPGADLGGNRSITDTLSWQITLKRVS
jgi:hypothetical protein